MMIGIRGATAATANNKAEILMKTKELLLAMIQSNNLKKEKIASIFFTMTHDLDTVFPAEAARGIGLTEAALLCASEINVPGSLPKCIRVLVHYNGTEDMKPTHVYLHEAQQLREDLVQDKRKGAH